MASGAPGSPGNPATSADIAAYYSGLSPWTAGILAGAGGIAGAFPNNAYTSGSGSGTTTTSGATTSDTTSQQNLNSLIQYLQNLQTTQQTTSTALPVLGPEAQSLLDTLTQKYQGLTAPSLTGYLAQQTGNINANADIQRQSINNIMAARGLGTSPVAATAQAGIEQNRLNQIASVQQQLPLLQNQMNLGNLGAAAAFFSAIPKGTTTGTTTTGTQTQTGGQQTSQATSGYTQGATTSQGTQQQNYTQSGQQQQGGGVGQGISGGVSTLISLLPFLAAL